MNKIKHWILRVVFKQELHIVMNRYKYLKHLRDTTDNFTMDYHIARLDEVMVLLDIFEIKTSLYVELSTSAELMLKEGI